MALPKRGSGEGAATSSDLRVNGKYWQDHLPAVEQRTAEGHAVRALYFYSGMADWVRYSGDQAYETAVTAIWENIASRKLYITGGFGARDNNEAFGEDYELPWRFGLPPRRVPRWLALCSASVCSVCTAKPSTSI